MNCDEPSIERFINMLRFFGTLTAFALILTSSAYSGQVVPYSKDELTKIQKSGENVVLQYHASWCPVCKKQRNALNTLVNDPKFNTVHFMTADYDTEIALKRKYGVKGQSTLILFKGENEVSRSQGVTDEVEL